jgi:hypothetical protein
MTTNRAADLRVRWRGRTPVPICLHVMLEVELNDAGHLTGHYNCVVCGEAVTKISIISSQT